MTDFAQIGSVVAGVNAGYDSAQFTVNDPEKAALIVMAAAHDAKIDGTVYPGRCLYQMDRGCPVGGEVVGVLVPGSVDGDQFQKFRTLREQLRQEFIAVVTPPHLGTPTRGFVVDLGAGDLKDVATRWQVEAAALLAQEKFHLSASIYDTGAGIVAQAEANPARISNLAAWEAAARGLIRRIQPDAAPVFRDVGYHSLEA